MKVDKIQWLEGARKAIQMSNSSPGNPTAQRYFRRLVKASPFSVEETARLLSGVSRPWRVLEFMGWAAALTDLPPGASQPKYRVVPV